MHPYETLLHTSPVSRCGRVGVAENLERLGIQVFCGVELFTIVNE